jgi:hypothetical protein
MKRTREVPKLRKNKRSFLSGFNNSIVEKFPHVDR